AIVAAIAWNNGGPLGVVATVVLGIAGFLVFFAAAVRLYQFPYVLVDRDCGVVDSIQISYEITRGHVLELVGLSLLSGVVALAGLLACGVGLLFTIPLSMLIQACTYALLVAGSPYGGRRKPRADLEFPDYPS